MSTKNVRIAGLALLLVSLLAVLQSCLTTHSQQEFVECQARYNETLNERTRILTEAADRERVSSRRVDDALAAVFAHPAALTPRNDQTPRQRSELDLLARAWGQAIIQQQQDRIEADKARAEHPVPAPPSSLCGKPASRPE
jgi:hypothetical protein